MTILAFDGKILAADTLSTADDTVVYNRSKIRIIKQTAIATCGDEEEGFKFEQWYFDQGTQTPPDLTDFGAFILDTKSIHSASDNSGSIKIWVPRTKFSYGAEKASAYADALMREVRFNAHKAAEAAAGYDRGCGGPIYSLTQAHLKAIDPAFQGFWIGTYDVPLKRVKDYCITLKQWHRS